VLFCDLVGSTEIAAQLDPEEWREVAAGYHRTAAEAINRFDGHVAKYLGDGVMAYFGWPEAHDNDGERAARAGLTILEAISKLNDNSAHPKLTARVGIDSGPVVVGAGAGQEADVFGETPNIASRLQATAAPGTVLITAATHRLISGLFVVEALGSRMLKGVIASTEVFQVVRPTGVRGRLGAARGLTPFVGREEELRLLLYRWERTNEGEGQMALVIGEPGIGKSRLVGEFHDRIRDTPHIWMESGGEQFFENTPFHAIREMPSQWLELQGGANAAEQLERLERALESAGLAVAEAAPLIADLLQLPAGERYPPARLTAEDKRRRLFAALVGWVLGAARLQPVVMVAEDLHWLDPSSLELLQLLGEQGATVPLMLLYTARPEFHVPWPMRAHHSQIALNRLSPRNVRQMVSLVAANNALVGESLDAVVERTGGVPLFVEELTRVVLESSSARIRGHVIPATLRDSLMARLDRLGSAKEVVQIGAVIGSDFSYGLLHAVHPLPEQDLQRAILSATDAELVYVRGIPPDAHYQFKHALIRDAAYEALLKTRRKELHMRVARAINEKFPTLKEGHPEILARHWTEAGEIEQATPQWLLAAKAAHARNAFKEAQESYEQALSCLHLLPESRERDSRELAVRQSIISVVNLTKGYAAPETIKAVDEAIALAEKTGTSPELVNLLASRASTLLVSGELKASKQVGERALLVAKRQGSSSETLVFLHQQQTIVHYWLGDLKGAEGHFIALRERLDELDLNRPASLGTFRNVVVNGLAFGSYNAWLLGRPDVGREREARMITIAQRGSPFEIANSGYLTLARWLGEFDRAEALATSAIELSERHHLPNPAARCRTLLGWARAHLGHADEGVMLMQQALAELRKIGTRMGMTATMTDLAQAQGLAGNISDSLESIEIALHAFPDELVFRPETLRLRGELRLKQGDVELAEADFRNAIVLARGMGAKGWELRTTMSLARMLDQTGRSREARAILAEIYNWFTEGFDTADLKDAKALLDELRG
jgi:class 3 adenylate cyclase/tetratricopeptide (TPR) repeat protein